MPAAAIHKILTAHQNEYVHYLPNHQQIEDFVDKLFDTLFTNSDSITNLEILNSHIQTLKVELNDIFYDIYKDNSIAYKQTTDFFTALPDIIQILQQDALQAYNADPAADSIYEIYNAYPGFYAITLYRFAHQLVNQNVPLIPRIITEYAHKETGIDIHPKAKIGHHFVIDHGTGIVIGETCIIGDFVTIYQGVTLGAIYVEKKLAAQKRHPTIEDHVVIYANATILGGDTIIGHHSIIGGNVWLTKSVAPHTVAYQHAQIVIRDQSPLPEPINFVI